jgi:hypothetical protein
VPLLLRAPAGRGVIDLPWIGHGDFAPGDPRRSPSDLLPLGDS